MKYLAAYLLLQQGGNATPAAADISALLESVGSEVDQAKVQLLLASLEGKSVSDLITEGASKLASIPSGGASSAGAASSGAAAGSNAEAAAEEEVEEKEESDDDMGFGLFD